ncbi:MAG: M28 family peptidase [bacterium]|uniref:M28 family peptidase n=1 Tax=Gimesia chilikensis TaxID=2605989 RepID=UPI0011EC5F73|nr:M28 family peptidase [Gimesia chilikensis]KAA0142470.1 M28 family peptidase [Gimesia chilikensis]MCR9231015.1 M28 family peptidase [bacterium]
MQFTQAGRRVLLLSFPLMIGAVIYVCLVNNACAAEPEFNAARSFGYLTKICRLKSRVSGSTGMAEQQKLIAEHFRELKAQVKFQSFDAPHPIRGTPVRMNNMIVSWNPDAKQRILLACHYDTRPFPDRDRYNPQGLFIGANDGASGVAFLMELGNLMSELKISHGYGVDFVFFDGEELVYRQNDPYFLGSKYFANQYKSEPRDYEYVYGVLFDMIADKNLAIYMEKNSIKYAPQLTRSIWLAAQKVGVRQFIPQAKFEIRDDHLPLNEIAGIPTCDIIDFDYPAWHTTRDVPRACSGASLEKVGKVMIYWLQNIPEVKN